MQKLLHKVKHTGDDSPLEHNTDVPQAMTQWGTLCLWIAKALPSNLGTIHTGEG